MQTIPRRRPQNDFRPLRSSPKDGTIRVIYDHQRYTENREGKTGAGSVMMAVFREEDVRAGKTVSEAARLRVEVTRLAQP